MATILHIWLLWWQTSTHLQSHADPQDFSHGLEKRLNNGSQACFKSQPMRSQLWGCHLRYESRPRVILHVKGEVPLDKERVRPLWSLNAALLGQQPHTQPHPHAAARPHLPPNNGNERFKSAGTEEVLRFWCFFLTKGHAYLVLI